MTAAAYENAYLNADLAAAYEDGNRMPEASLRAWADLITCFAPRTPAEAVEIGAGTGMFCDALVRYGRARRVMGVEPSSEMLSRARALHPDPRISYVEGDAVHVPTEDDAFDLMLISRVIHHLPDRKACAREAARVLRPDGVVVIRTTFRERLDALVYAYWPQALENDRLRFPARDEVVADFAAAGFTVRADTQLSQPVAANLRQYYERLTARPQSKLATLSDADFADGLLRLQLAAAAEPADAPPVQERYDLLVMEPA
jgi:ubiquinone/menaquinone biosynthesis C-methylase UbiE